MNLLRAELTKIRTTPLWWIFALIALPLWAASMGANWIGANLLLNGPADSTGGAPADQIEAAREPVSVATSLYTSGQYFGLLLVLLFAAIVMTNEYFHQTATTTFLVTPVRSRVVFAKLAASALVAIGFWLVTTVFNLILAPLILRSLHVGPQLGTSAVWQAIGLNALAYALWGVLGVGAGVLVRSQIAATIILTVTYLIGSSAVSFVFVLLSQRVAEWIGKLQVIVPTSASQLMIAGTELPGSPPRWVGAVVLLGYAVLMGTIGTLITQRRDIT
jgi:ABC-2 type transport system permease protein